MFALTLSHGQKRGPIRGGNWREMGELRWVGSKFEALHQPARPSLPPLPEPPPLRLPKEAAAAGAAAADDAACAIPLFSLSCSRQCSGELTANPAQRDKERGC